MDNLLELNAPQQAILEEKYDYTLVILGEPKKQERHRTFQKKDRDGRPYGFPRRYDPSSIMKENLRKLVQEKAPPKPIDQPIRVDCIFYFPRPKAHYGTGKNLGKLKDNAPVWHTKKPDRDNLDKFVLDALSKVFWRDDSLVCDGRIIKLYSDKPRTVIGIKLL